MQKSSFRKMRRCAVKSKLHANLLIRKDTVMGAKKRHCCWSRMFCADFWKVTKIDLFSCVYRYFSPIPTLFFILISRFAWFTCMLWDRKLTRNEKLSRFFKMKIVIPLADFKKTRQTWNSDILRFPVEFGDFLSLWHTRWVSPLGRPHGGLNFYYIK